MDRPARPGLPILVLALALMGGCRPAATSPDTSSDEISTAGLAGVDPANLKLVEHGTDKELTFKAPRPGLLYVYDVESNNYLLKGLVLAAGDTFVLPQDSSHARLKKQSIELEHDTYPHHEYQLWFDPQ